MLPPYIISAIIAAIIIGIAGFVAQTSSPYTAGFIAAIPIGLISMTTFPDHPEMHRTFALGILAYVVFAFLFYALVDQNGWDRTKALYACVGGWLAVILSMWVVAR